MRYGHHKCSSTPQLAEMRNFLRLRCSRGYPRFIIIACYRNWSIHVKRSMDLRTLTIDGRVPPQKKTSTNANLELNNTVEEDNALLELPSENVDLWGVGEL